MIYQKFILLIFLLTLTLRQATSTVWILDSGAEVHVTCNRTAMSEAQPTNLNLIFPNGNTLKIYEKGIARIGNITLSNVLYSDKLIVNLISIKQLTNDGYNVMFTSKDATVTLQQHQHQHNGFVTASLLGNLYVIKN